MATSGTYVPLVATMCHAWRLSVVHMHCSSAKPGFTDAVYVCRPYSVAFCICICPEHWYKKHWQAAVIANIIQHIRKFEPQLHRLDKHLLINKAWLVCFPLLSAYAHLLLFATCVAWRTTLVKKPWLIFFRSAFTATLWVGTLTGKISTALKKTATVKLGCWIL